MVGHFGKIRQRARVRLLSIALLANVLALTSAPVCGSPLDVDSGKCCEGRACHQPIGPRHPLTQSSVATNTRDSCCSPTAKNSSAPSDTDRCCEHGRLIYPTIKPQPSTSATIILPVAPVVVPQRSTVDANTLPSVFVESALKIPIRPVYTLTSAYRI